MHDAADRAFGRPQAQHHVDPQAIEVALTIFGFAEFHAGGHMQQVADRRRAVFRILKTRHIGLCRVID